MQPPDELAAILRRVLLFSDLNDSERAVLQGLFRPVFFKAGELLFRQGAPADGLYLIAEGLVVVSVRLPGDDEVQLDTLGAGDLVGDMALIDRQARSASARAIEETHAWFLDYPWFDAQRAQFGRSAFKVLRRLALILCARLRDTNREMAVDLPLGGADPRAEASELPPGNARKISIRDQPLLRFLPIFRDFSDTELVALTKRMRRLDLPRGQLLFTEGEPGASCFVTLRGAVEVSMHRGEKHRLAILGPGKMFGQVALLDGGERSATCKVRESAALLELEQEEIARIFAEEGPVAFKLMGILLHTLIGAQREADAALARRAALKKVQDWE